MASAPVANSGFTASLLQDLAVNSPLSSTFSSPSLQNALQEASTGDLVTLSAEALQLQQADLLFTDSNSVTASGAASDSLTSILSAVEQGSPSSGVANAVSTPSLANEAAAYESELQSENIQTLFGMGAAQAPASVLDALG